MFSGIFDKIQTVQEGISSSLKGLALGEPITGTVGAEETAGCSLLLRYTNEWEEISGRAQANAKMAKDLDVKLTEISGRVRHKKDIWAAVTAEVESLDDVIRSAETVVNLVGKLRMDIASVEEDLIRLENLIEIEELYKKKKLERQKLDVYKAQRLKNLDSFRAHLSTEHFQRLKQREEEEASEAAARATEFTEKFGSDLKAFKETGVVPQPKNPGDTQTSTLEDLVLDQDTDELEKYLEST